MHSAVYNITEIVSGTCWGQVTILTDFGIVRSVVSGSNSEQLLLSNE